MQSSGNSHVIRGGHHQHRHQHLHSPSIAWAKAITWSTAGRGMGRGTYTYICINKYLVVSALARLLKWAMGQSKSKCLHTLTVYGLCGFAANRQLTYADSFPTLADDDYGQKTVSVLVDNIETDLEVIDHPACEMSVSINQLTNISMYYIRLLAGCLCACACVPAWAALLWQRVGQTWFRFVG